MAKHTITHPNSKFSGVLAGIRFKNGAASFEAEDMSFSQYGMTLEKAEAELVSLGCEVQIEGERRGRSVRPEIKPNEPPPPGPDVALG